VPPGEKACYSTLMGKQKWLNALLRG